MQAFNHGSKRLFFDPMPHGDTLLWQQTKNSPKISIGFSPFCFPDPVTESPKLKPGLMTRPTHPHVGSICSKGERHDAAFCNCFPQKKSVLADLCTPFPFNWRQPFYFPFNSYEHSEKTKNTWVELNPGKTQGSHRWNLWSGQEIRNSWAFEEAKKKKSSD